MENTPDFKVPGLVNKLRRSQSLLANRLTLGRLVIVIAAILLWQFGILCWFLLLTEHGARTTGQMLFFDKDRRLLFKGGIAESRGHQGDNDNLQGAMSVCRSQVSEIAVTPVYGCSLR